MDESTAREKANDICREILDRGVDWDRYPDDEFPDEVLKLAEGILSDMYFMVPYVRGLVY